MLAGVPVASCVAQSVSGVWDVVKVSVNRRDQVHWVYSPDDPRLLGRELVVAAGEVRFNDGSSACRQPVWSKRTERLGQLIGTSFPRETDAGSSPSTLRDFQMAGDPAQRVVVNVVRCAPSSDGRDAQPWNEAWFVAPAADRLMMRIGTSALVTLARRQKNAVAKPSFACASAASAVEKLICGSVPLAALDRSVAAAFKRKSEQTDRVQLTVEQTSWLKRRDACGSDESCVADAMRARLEELMQG